MRKSKPLFKVGDPVTWFKSYLGFKTYYEGTVVAIVLPHTELPKRLRGFKAALGNRRLQKTSVTTYIIQTASNLLYQVRPSYLFHRKDPACSSSSNSHSIPESPALPLP